MPKAKTNKKDNKSAKTEKAVETKEPVKASKESAQSNPNSW